MRNEIPEYHNDLNKQCPHSTHDKLDCVCVPPKDTGVGKIKTVEEIVSEAKKLSGELDVDGGWNVPYEGIIEARLFDWLRTTLTTRNLTHCKVLIEKLEEMQVAGQVYSEYPPLEAEWNNGFDMGQKIAIEKAQQAVKDLYNQK